MRKSLIAAVVAASLFTLAACGNDDDTDTAASHNEADVTFAQEMIPHHQQAIEMADLAESRAESQEVKDVAADIEAAQGPEIETLTGWLESWGEDVPDEGMSSMDHGDMSSDEMGGMMTEDEMAELEAASGAAFDQMFLTMMIEHHEGAIEMAKTEQAEGEFPEAVDMAEEIETTQAEEIQKMQDLLKS
ncbi:DUF305 domain-containing protein [Nocardioides aquiterrae]|uniref:DUF305 domain-containing protein n=1 Tax=Nocardioides aquiterrae TaxID=203799 RepID=A0ABN1U912_9ACTN